MGTRSTLYKKNLNSNKSKFLGGLSIGNDLRRYRQDLAKEPRFVVIVNDGVKDKKPKIVIGREDVDILRKSETELLHRVRVLGPMSKEKARDTYNIELKKYRSIKNK